MPPLSDLTAVVSALFALFTTLGAVLPKGSALGKFFGKFGADVKGHNS